MSLKKISFDDSHFQLAHGKKPSGRGSWAFSYDGEDEPFYFSPSMLFSEAKKEAKRLARAQGRSGVIEVCS